MCCSSKRVGLLCRRAVMAALSFVFLLAVVYGVLVKAYVGRTGPIRPEWNRTGTRWLLGVGEETTERMGEGCSRDMVVVYQGATAPLPNGIPTYTVQILNTCLSGCAVSGIHVSCGWFSSARLVNPRVFRRIGFDDCLVNDGAPLGPGESLTFEYANTFRYPLYVSSVSCD